MTSLFIVISVLGQASDPVSVESGEARFRVSDEQRLHWSFQPLREVPPPGVANEEWSGSEIDRFIFRTLEARGLEPSPPAEKPALIRRATFDITGLPPTPHEVEAFVNDHSDGAFEKVIDRLLQSKAYGQRWARHWLDLVRYADGFFPDADHGSADKFEFFDAWRYRDWVINALNAGMSFDQFTLEQIAGDMLPEATNSQLIATAFHRNTMTNSEGGTDDEEFRTAAVVDRVNTTMQVWMGITFGCAQCHTHKFDPISQTEYYQLSAFFNNTEEEVVAERFNRLFLWIELNWLSIKKKYHSVCWSTIVILKAKERCLLLPKT